MERIETNIIGGCGSEATAQPCPEEASPRKSGNGSKGAQAAAAGKKAAPTQSDFLPELALLQCVFAKARKAGLDAETQQMRDEKDGPVLVLNLFGIRACESCNSWYAEDACPTCEEMKKGK